MLGNGNQAINSLKMKGDLALTAAPVFMTLATGGYITFTIYMLDFERKNYANVPIKY